MRGGSFKGQMQIGIGIRSIRLIIIWPVVTLEYVVVPAYFVYLLWRYPDPCIPIVLSNVVNKCTFYVKGWLYAPITNLINFQNCLFSD
jgi:hypothetical protein